MQTALALHDPKLPRVLFVANLRTIHAEAATVRRELEMCGSPTIASSRTPVNEVTIRAGTSQEFDGWVVMLVPFQQVMLHKLLNSSCHLDNSLQSILNLI